MIKISGAEIKLIDSKARIEATFDENGKKNCIWYEVDEKYKEYLTEERADGFVIALLLYAMKVGSDIYVLSPMSKKLFYTLNKYLIPLLSQIHNLDIVRIYCNGLKSEPLPNKGAVGTGLSCGIDSFSTILDHTEINSPDCYEISHFTFFNVGSHGSENNKARSLFRKRNMKIKEAAKSLGKDLITVDSNISKFFNMGFEASHTIRSMSAVLILQKFFKTYYYSSAVHVGDFNLKKSSMGYYDIFSLNMLSTESVELYSSCATKSRVEKTRMIAGYPPTLKYLDVCVFGTPNCSKCHKCLRTLFTLELIGKLDLYSEVFNLRVYYSEREKFIAHILAFYKNNTFLREIYEEMKLNHVEVPVLIRLYAGILKTKMAVKSKFLGRGTYTKFKKIIFSSNF